MFRFLIVTLAVFAFLTGCEKNDSVEVPVSIESESPSSTSALEAALHAENTTSMIVIKNGRTVFSYGPVDNEIPTYVASVRKSILAMLMGEWVENETIDLESTLSELNIQDLETLNDSEQQASLRDLISSRSGVYHPAANSSGLDEENPKRGEHKPGSFFWYNNWDFNVAGFVFEKQTGTSIYDEFQRQFADPMKLTSFDLSGHKEARDNTPAEGSLYTPFHFFLSANDLAKLGQLMLQDGLWDGKRLMPKGWMKEVTSFSTRSENMNPSDYRNGELGFGYMWWVFDPTTAPDSLSGAYLARGHFGQYLLVLPQFDMVIAHKTSPQNYGDGVEYNEIAVDWPEFRRLVDLSIEAYAVDSGLWHLLAKPSEAADYDYCTSTKEYRLDSELETELSSRLGPDGRMNGEERAAAILVEAGMVVAEIHESDTTCSSALREGADLFEGIFQRHLADMQAQLDASLYSDDEIGSAQRSIANAWVEDQGSRLAYIELLNPEQPGSSEYWAFERSKANAVFLDWEHRMLVEELLNRFEWIDQDRFGSLTADRVLTLIQHADADPTFQRMALDRMGNHLGLNGVSPSAYANLWDRVAINSGQLQRYGTQPQAECDVDGQLSPLLIEAIESLPERRREMNLEPIEEQMRRLSQERCS